MKELPAETFREVAHLAYKALAAVVNDKSTRAIFGLLLAGAWAAREMGWERKHVVAITGILYDASHAAMEGLKRESPEAKLAKMWAKPKPPAGSSN